MQVVMVVGVGGGGGFHFFKEVSASARQRSESERASSNSPSFKYAAARFAWHTYSCGWLTFRARQREKSLSYAATEPMKSSSCIAVMVMIFESSAGLFKSSRAGRVRCGQ